MNETSDTAEFDRKKQLFTVLPLFIVPVLVLLFWGLGGGTSSAASVDPGASEVGHVNTGLPGAMVERSETKSEAYRMAKQEADRLAYAQSRDPYAAMLSEESTDGADLGSSPSGVSDWEKRFTDRTGNLENQLSNFNEAVDASGSSAAGESQPTPGDRRRRTRSSPSTQTKSVAATQNLDFGGEDEQVAEIERAIAKLQNSGAVASGYEGAFAPTGEVIPPPAGGTDALSLTAGDSVANEQLARLDRIMERATLLQYPKLAEEELRKRSLEDDRHLYPVAEAPSAAGDIKIFGVAPRPDSVPVRRQTGFFTDDSQDQGSEFTQLTVRAQVHNSVVVMDGSTVKLRLLEDVYVAGQRIPANTFVYGQGSLNGDRLSVIVSTITYRNNLYDVGLNVYDLDGQPGLAVPGSVERQIAKREAASAARGIGGSSIGGGNLTAQLAAEGTQTIKEIASRKISVIKVELKAGHRVILRNK